MTPPGVWALLALAACAGPEASEPEGRPHIRVQPPWVDFGPIFPGESLEREVEIFNHGDADLRLANVSLEESGFDLQTPGDEWFIILPPEMSLELQIAFEPDEPGRYEGSLRVRSDDPMKPVLRVVLFGIGRRGGP